MIKPRPAVASGSPGERFPGFRGRFSALLLGVLGLFPGGALPLALQGVATGPAKRAAEVVQNPQTDPESEEAYGDEEEVGGEEDLGDEEGGDGEGRSKERRVGWRLRARSDNKASLSFPTGDRSVPRVTIERATTAVAWHIRLALEPFAVEDGQRYLLRFRARSDGPRTIGVGLAQAQPPFAPLDRPIQIQVTPLWRTYRAVVELEEPEERASMHFNLGGNRYAVELADISIARGSDRSILVTAPQGPLRRPADESSEVGDGD